MNNIWPSSHFTPACAALPAQPQATQAEKGRDQSENWTLCPAHEHNHRSWEGAGQEPHSPWSYSCAASHTTSSTEALSRTKDCRTGILASTVLSPKTEIQVKPNHQDFTQHFQLHGSKASHHSCTGEEEVQIQTCLFPRHGLVMGCPETPPLLCSHHSAQAVGLLFDRHHSGLSNSSALPGPLLILRQVIKNVAALSFHQHWKWPTCAVWLFWEGDFAPCHPTGSKTPKTLVNKQTINRNFSLCTCTVLVRMRTFSGVCMAIPCREWALQSLSSPHGSSCYFSCFCSTGRHSHPASNTNLGTGSGSA